jgi:hypothetical protein
MQDPDYKFGIDQDDNNSLNVEEEIPNQLEED